MTARLSLRAERGNPALSFTEATLLITGSGLGTGILAIPYIMAKVGLVQAVFALLLAGAVSCISHLMIADLSIHSKDSEQLLEMFRRHLFNHHKRGERIFVPTFFALLFIMLLLNLALYITCAAEIIHSTFGLNYYVAQVLFYLLASILVVLGIKSIGMSEKWSMRIIAEVVLVLGILALFNFEGGMEFFGGTPLMFVSLYAMCMFSFSAVFSVPQVVRFISDKSKIRRSVILGVGCNVAITLVFSLTTLYACKTVTAVATIGLSEYLGPVVKILSAVFVVLAVLTSYLSISLALIQVIREQTKLPKLPVWLISTLPAIIVALLLPISYNSYIELVGGVFAIIIALMVLPSYYNSVKNSSGLLLGDRLGKNIILIAIIFVFYILMAAGALIPID